MNLFNPPWINRTIAARCLIVLGLISSWTPASANEQAASEFMVTLNRDAVSQYADTTLNEEEKVQRMRELAERTFDIPRMSKFVLGVNWRRATPEQKKEFIEIFREVNTQRFLPLFSKYSDQKFTVTNVRRDEKRQNVYFVASTLDRPQGEPVNVEWRLYDDGDAFHILDVVAEGISMVLTLRKEYGSVIKNNGIDGLLDQLRDKLRTDATESADSSTTQ